MNKNIIIAISAAVLLTGCTKNITPVRNEPAGGEISFSSYNGRTQTKYQPPTLYQSFNVEAFAHGNPSVRYFYSTSYRCNNDRFIGDTTRYWTTTGEHLDFYAVSPLTYTNTSGAEVALRPVDSTVVVTSNNGLTDILGARIVDQERIDPVVLPFSHKLTRVKFRIEGADPSKIYKIDTLTIEANSSAKYHFGAVDYWSDASDSLEYGPVKDYEYQDPDDGYYAVYDPLYLIPNQDSVKAKVRYSIYDGNFLIDTTTTPVEINLPVEGIWGINKSVTYKLTLYFSTSAQPIRFTATLSDWGADQEVYAPAPDYIEGGVNYGKGVKIGDRYWAPVNCGYDSLNFKYGKLYQWGRKDGCGYVCNDDPSTTIDEASCNDSGGLVQTMSTSTTPISAENENPALFYNISDSPYDWLTPKDDSRWNSGTEENPVKTEYDPCPAGWRVPTKTEIVALRNSCNISINVIGTHGSSTVYGAKFTTKSDPSKYVFLPSAGKRITLSGFRVYWEGGAEKHEGRYWTSTAIDTRAYKINFFNGPGGIIEGPIHRREGYSVRCISE